MFRYIYIHIYTYTYIHTHTHTYMYIYVYRYIYASSHSLPYFPAKEPYISAKEPYISAKEPCVQTHRNQVRYSHFPLQCVCKRILDLRKRALYLRKKPLYTDQIEIKCADSIFCFSKMPAKELYISAKEPYIKAHRNRVRYCAFAALPAAV